MICGRCGQDEKQCGQCYKRTFIRCPNWFRMGAHLRPCTKRSGHTKRCAFVEVADMAVKRNYTYLQGILRSGISIADVVERYRLDINRSKKHPNLIQFKYNQIESDLSDPLVKQCRGIIFDEDNNWEIVARPFDKFFNYGEKDAAVIDWNTARVQEKLDGTCCILYYYKGWNVATLGSADASGDVHGIKDITFHKLFWDTFTDKGYKVPDTMWDSVTFIFELTSPYNRVVVPHATRDLRLLGARLADGSESSIAGNCSFDLVKQFPLQSMDDVKASFEKMSPLKQEGYVIVDGRYNRIKVKHPGYVRIHHLKDSFTLRNITECVRMGEDIEFLNYFPEHQGIVEIVKASFRKLVQDCVDTYALTEHHTTNKAFAKDVEDIPYKGVLFAVRNGKRKSIVDALQQMHVDNLIALMEVDLEGDDDTSTDEAIADT